MKLHAKIGDDQQDIEISRDGDTVTARMGDREYTLDVAEPDPGLYALRNGSSLTTAFVSKGASGSSKVTIAGHEFDVGISDPKRLRGSAVDAAHAGGTAEIKTMMPGKVVRILVEAGAEVKKGDGVIVVEAMKMQNEMKSPKDGIVKELRSTEGATVNAGDVLVVIE
jgi:acetyl/propionyl-CoA carboxylase alpha subunit